MILVQREFTVPREHRAEFERQSSQGLWPAFLHFGAQMVAFGSWGFGASSEPLVTHTVYEDFEHWEATRAGRGAYYGDAAIVDEIGEYTAVYGERSALISNSTAQPFELFDGISRPRPFRRSAGQDLAELPPTFGRGSVISERTLSLHDGAREEFLRLSADPIWPWLESQGGRGVAVGHNMMGSSDEVTTWFAFPSMDRWYQCARPHSAHAPQAVVEAYTNRQQLVRHQRGRILTVGTDWGRRLA
ncbi:MAG: hypothetical protein WD058_08155 [Dehalococcoidia bacterium]